MACISQLHVAIFLVPSTSSGAFKHVYVDDAWNVAPQSKRMFEWLILFSQNPLIDHVFLWYQYINQYLSTCFPHVGTNLVFFPGFNLLIYEPRIFIRPLERDRHGRKTHCLGYVVWICQGNDVWFSNMLVFYEGIHVWQSLKKNQRKRWKKKRTYVICEHGFLTYVNASLFLATLFVIFCAVHGWFLAVVLTEARIPDRKGSVPDRGSR